MSLPHALHAHRHDTENRAMITLTGEVDLDSAPLIRETLGRCLLDGIRTIDVDLTAVSFCDCSGINAFLAVALRTTEAGGVLRLHHPAPAVARVFALTGSAALLLDEPAAVPVPGPAARAA
ncbi:STAS domain-containing protein [Streptomyces sp. NBC_00669]|uniref:STAS domain-containing protein n=1 Tax=unclassified Streptomyces TaxID=2593676 RepID=UPI002E33EF61|nr:STAS domain-containing protein [Streptomyces sp. NBC_00669]